MNKANSLRHILRWLWENHGAPKLDHQVHRYPGLRPRNVTAREDERDAILRAAPDHLRLWLLLCADLAIRSGTASRLGPEHYNPATGSLSFQTKYGERLTLPTTADVDALIQKCDQSDPAPFVRQLWHRANKRASRTTTTQYSLNVTFKRLRLSLGITRKLTPHDLRRTAAVAMLRHTRDVNAVRALLGHRSLQSTIWYLDHDLMPVERETLEAIKRPFIVARKEQSA